MEQGSPFSALDELARIAAVLVQFGVTDGVANLQDPRATPEACLKSASDSLYLLGYHGRKWRDELWLPRELDRLGRRRGQVRFLLAPQDEEGRMKFHALTQRWPATLDVRTSERANLFRLVIMDRRRMLLGHYGHEVIRDDGVNAMGWESPHLLVQGDGEWSLLVPFLALFDILWNEAEPIAPPAPTSKPQKREFK